LTSFIFCGKIRRKNSAIFDGQQKSRLSEELLQPSTGQKVQLSLSGISGAGTGGYVLGKACEVFEKRVISH
jgi:hypothetical protein